VLFRFVVLVLVSVAQAPRMKSAARAKHNPVNRIIAPYFASTIAYAVLPKDFAIFGPDKFCNEVETGAERIFPTPRVKRRSPRRVFVVCRSPLARGRRNLGSVP
jgi:hypothetical protein